MLTILYGNNYTCLDLVAKTPDEANIWLAGLTHLISKRDAAESEGLFRVDIRLVERV